MYLDPNADPDDTAPMCPWTRLSTPSFPIFTRPYSISSVIRRRRWTVAESGVAKGVGIGATSFPQPRSPVASRVAVLIRNKSTAKSSSHGRLRRDDNHVRPSSPSNHNQPLPHARKRELTVIYYSETYEWSFNAATDQ
jgi:hypothetical protein